MRSDTEIQIWVNSLVGKDWTPERNCWWLVREAFQFLYSIDLPMVNVAEDTPENVAAIKHAAAVSGWRPVTGTPQNADVLLLWGTLGRHIGMMLRLGDTLRVLHCEGGPASPRPGVLWEPLPMVLSRFSKPECWRLQTSV